MRTLPASSIWIGKKHETRSWARRGRSVRTICSSRWATSMGALSGSTTPRTPVAWSQARSRSRFDKLATASTGTQRPTLEPWTARNASTAAGSSPMGRIRTSGMLGSASIHAPRDRGSGARMGSRPRSMRICESATPSNSSSSRKTPVREGPPDDCPPCADPAIPGASATGGPPHLAKRRSPSHGKHRPGRQPVKRATPSPEHLRIRCCVQTRSRTGHGESSCKDLMSLRGTAGSIRRRPEGAVSCVN